MHTLRSSYPCIPLDRSFYNHCTISLPKASYFTLMVSLNSPSLSRINLSFYLCTPFTCSVCTLYFAQFSSVLSLKYFLKTYLPSTMYFFRLVSHFSADTLNPSTISPTTLSSFENYCFPHFDHPVPCKSQANALFVSASQQLPELFYTSTHVCIKFSTCPLVSQMLYLLSEFFPPPCTLRLPRLVCVYIYEHVVG